MGIVVEDYDSLDSYPKLILYEGYYCRGKGQEIAPYIEKK